MSVQQGFLLIADITGYTSYLNESELDHANDVLKSLLELLIDHTRAPLVISRLAGDAVISYGLQTGFLSGEAFVEILEDTYVAFRKMIDIIVLNTTCQCNACANINNLDLKFFVHFGTFALQKLDAHDELVGADVNIIHRLLKNHITETTGIRAYSVYTDAAVEQLGIQEISKSMLAHTEAYEHIGEIRTWILDMHPIWEAEKATERTHIPPEQAVIVVEEIFPVPVSLAWEIVTNPVYRTILVNSDRQEVRSPKNGRLGPGSEYHCFHNNGLVTRETILEWLPLEQITTEDTSFVSKATSLVTVQLEPVEGGTMIRATAGKSRGPLLNRTISNLLGRFLIPHSLRHGMAKLRTQVELDIENGVLEIPGYFRRGEVHVHENVHAGPHSTH